MQNTCSLSTQEIEAWGNAWAKESVANLPTEYKEILERGFDLCLLILKPNSQNPRQPGEIFSPAKSWTTYKEIIVRSPNLNKTL